MRASRVVSRFLHGEAGGDEVLCSDGSSLWSGDVCLCRHSPDGSVVLTEPEDYEPLRVRRHRRLLEDMVNGRRKREV